MMRHRAGHAPEVPALYCIRVVGSVDPRWSDWFGGLALTTELGAGRAPVTTLRGNLPDQAALRGILNRLWDMNLTLLAVERLPAAAEKELGDDQ